jgi:hypothetical protein
MVIVVFTVFTCKVRGPMVGGDPQLSSGGAGTRIVLPGLAQAHPVALDTRLPASHGPSKTIPAPASAKGVLVLFKTTTL